MEATHTPLRDVLTPRHPPQQHRTTHPRGHPRQRHPPRGSRTPQSDDRTPPQRKPRTVQPQRNQRHRQPRPHELPHTPKPHRCSRRPHTATAGHAETQTQPRQRLTTSGQKRAELDKRARVLPLLKLFGVLVHQTNKNTNRFRVSHIAATRAADPGAGRSLGPRNSAYAATSPGLGFATGAA